MNEENKDAELKALKESITRAHGKGSVTQLSDVTPFDENKIYHSGSIALDVALGVGGYPKGRIIEIYGPESSGKTTLTLHAIAQVQAKGGVAAFVDAEHALDPVYARSLGVIIEDVLLSQPNYGEQALDIVEMMARSGAIDLIIVDSVAALTPKSEIEGEMGDHAVGAQARLMSKAMRKLVAVANESQCIIMFTNQIRMKIGVMFGSPETTSGGNALKFYCSQRLEVRRSTKIEEGSGNNKEQIGNLTKVKIVKNKVAPPFKTAEFNIIYGKGVDKYGEILQFAVEDGLIIKAGSWYKLADEDNTSIGQGEKLAIAWLKDHEEEAEEMRHKILSSRGLL